MRLLPTLTRTVASAVATAVLLGVAVLGRAVFSAPGQAVQIAPDLVPATSTLRLAPAAALGQGRPVSGLVSGSWVRGTAIATGIPVPAVRAYGSATVRLSRSDPSCRLGWTTLAGIGWVESQQGTIGGRTLGPDGRPDRPISGPALDGRGDRAAIRSVIGRWVRAAGPLQFLPSTWRTWASDGDGDGRADPQDLDDAAYAASRYLCASGQDLATAAGWTDAVRSYNHSDSYVRAVYDAANVYAARSAS
jgi:membrane-bound lytic murein transglycosylase B